MTARRLALDAMPDWPFELTLEQAAGYMGVSPSQFLAEVEAGIWPKGWARGKRGRGELRTWNRVELEQRRLARLGLAPHTATLEERRRAAKEQRAAARR